MFKVQGVSIIGQHCCTDIGHEVEEVKHIKSLLRLWNSDSLARSWGVQKLISSEVSLSSAISDVAVLRRIENPAPEAEASTSGAQQSAAGSFTAELGVLAASPLKELLTLGLPEGLQLAPQAADVLLLLKVLEALNRCIPPISARLSR